MIFIGKDGLRAGWCILIFFAILALLVFASQAAIHIIHPIHTPPKGLITARLTIATEGPVLVCVLLATWIMSRIERRPNSLFGLGGTRKLFHFLFGLIAGAVCLSVLVLILWQTSLLTVEQRLLFGTNIVRYGVSWICGFLLVAGLEEYLSRGYLQYTLTRGIRGFATWAFKSQLSDAVCFFIAAVILSILFSLGHGMNPGESPIGLITAGAAGLLFSFSLWRTQSLWWAIGFHASWDWAQSFLYGVADSGQFAQNHLLETHPLGAPILSGGATGPEGSIYALLILAFTGWLIYRTLPATTAPANT